MERGQGVTEGEADSPGEMWFDWVDAYTWCADEEDEEVREP